MEINSEWLKSNPINDVLQASENLLWIGRPNKEVYIRGNRTRPGIIRVCIWAFLPFIAAIIGVFFSPKPSGTWTSIIFLMVIPILVSVFLEPGDYHKASWYAFSEKRVLWTSWDREDLDCVVHWTELGSLKQVSVKQTVLERAENVGTLQGVCHAITPSKLSKKFTLRLIDDPLLVQKLLLDTKAASTI